MGQVRQVRINYAHQMNPDFMVLGLEGEFNTYYSRDTSFRPGLWYTVKVTETANNKKFLERVEDEKD